MDKLKAFEERCIKYDMMDALMIPKYCDGMTAYPANKWGGPETGVRPLVNFLHCIIVTGIWICRLCISFYTTDN